MGFPTQAVRDILLSAFVQGKKRDKVDDIAEMRSFL
jgi:hypothetical protein